MCASGSQVWTGKIGTLTANAIAKAANSHLRGIRADRLRLGDLNEVEREYAGSASYKNAVATTPTSMNADPAMVNRKNLRPRGRGCRIPATDQEVHRDENDLEEHEEEEEVEREERAEEAGLEQQHPRRVRLLVVGASAPSSAIGNSTPVSTSRNSEMPSTPTNHEDPPAPDPLVLRHELEAGLVVSKLASR